MRQGPQNKKGKLWPGYAALLAADFYLSSFLFDSCFADSHLSILFSGNICTFCISKVHGSPGEGSVSHCISRHLQFLFALFLNLVGSVCFFLLFLRCLEQDRGQSFKHWFQRYDTKRLPLEKMDDYFFEEHVGECKEVTESSSFLEIYNFSVSFTAAMLMSWMQFETVRKKANQRRPWLQDGEVYFDKGALPESEFQNFLECKVCLSYYLDHSPPTHHRC